MELQYVYQKKRSDFGRQCMFSDKGPDLIDNYPPTKEFMKNFVLRDPVDRSSQNSKTMALHTLNTQRAEFTNTGINHIEGGWPKDVNPLDEEQTKRYRRKVERDDGFNVTIFQLAKTMENCILQNNAVNIYQQYFSDVEPAPMVESSSARTVNVFRDHSLVVRPITNISWSPDNGSKLAVSYCNMVFQAESQPAESINSYIWDIENPNTPLYELKPRKPIVGIEYNPKDHNMLISGHFNGQVAVWDIRKGVEPIDHSLLEVSHRDTVTKALWIHSKSGCEFFSSSSDGQLIWWDHRKFNEPLETLIIDLNHDPQTLTNATGASTLEYEPSIPTRFTVGTEDGSIYACNRKGKTPQEKMNIKFDAHLGPVLTLQRNAAYQKNFLSVGDWTAKIWAEDCRESPLMSTVYHKAMIRDGAWSPARYSVFFTTRTDGVLDVWDILQQQKQACLSFKVCDVPLCRLRVNEIGTLAAVGNQSGTTYLIEFSENLTMCSKIEKALLNMMFERENKREKILEARNREIRLKLQQQQQELERRSEGDEEEGGEEGTAVQIDTGKFGPEWMTLAVKEIDTEFFQIVTEEMNKHAPIPAAEEEG